MNIVSLQCCKTCEYNQPIKSKRHSMCKCGTAEAYLGYTDILPTGEKLPKNMISLCIDVNGFNFFRQIKIDDK